MTISFPVPAYQVPCMPPQIPDSTIAEWLVDLRTKAGLRQDEVDQRTRAMGHRISQSYLSQLERGLKPLENMDGAKMAALRKVYNVSAEEWAQKTGLSIVSRLEGDEALSTIPLPPLTDAERRGWTLPPEEEPEIPDALLEAAEMYGHGKNAPLAERRWLVELAGLDFREEPETPEDWLAVYVRLSKLIDPK